MAQERHLKPGREYTTPLRVNIRVKLPQETCQVDHQFSYTGLKAYIRNYGGTQDRKALFHQIKQAYVHPSPKPNIWFCVVGINDLKHVRYEDIAANPRDVFQQFVQFFDQLRRFSPGSNVVWLSVGNAEAGNTTPSVINTFRRYLLHRQTAYPTWLTFEDITGDCTAKDIKDHHGHWKDSYVKRVAERVVRCIANKATTSRIHGEYITCIDGNQHSIQ